MVPSGAFGLPLTEDAGSVRSTRWVDANRSKSNPAPRQRAERTLRFIEAEPGTRVQGIEICGDTVTPVRLLGVPAGARSFARAVRPVSAETDH